MSYFRGRPMIWDPDRRALELERQRWVMEKVGGTNQVIAELTVDPDQAYRAHRAEFERTGDPLQLHLMLQYVK